MAIKSFFSCTRRVDLEVDTEMLVCELRTGGRHCLIFSVFYRPPYSGEDFLVCFESFLDKFAATDVSNLIITGDFNFPHINWSTGSPNITDNLTESFCNILDDHFLMQMNYFVTCTSSSSSITATFWILYSPTLNLFLKTLLYFHMPLSRIIFLLH